MEWSKYQKAIFEDVSKSDVGHVIVEAVAGSSKTTTLIESLAHIPENKTALLVAFNKHIAEELKKRVPRGFFGEISTLHALGLKALGKTYKIKVNPDKTADIIAKLVGKEKEQSDLRFALQKAVSNCKNSLSLEKAEIDWLLDEKELDIPIERNEFISLILKVLELSKSNVEFIDFDDMIFLPNVLPVKFPKFDYVFVDEAQDINNAQVGLILQTIDPFTRVFIYCDPDQAIYVWRNAEADIITKLKDKLKAKSLPLSISYRCPVKVVKEAQRFVPHMESAPEALDGKVERITLEQLKKEAQPGCFILSRTNAPIIGLALHFIKKGIPANICGKDLGANLKSLVKRSRCKNIEKFLEYIEKWTHKEVDRLKENNRDFSVVLDKLECFKALAEVSKDTKELMGNIDKLFLDGTKFDKIILGTVHSTKGDERDTVYLLDWTFRYHTAEEKRIRYVALTRSKNSLYFVSK